ncbi:LPXTG cell wall anchor domain-containing protein [Amycolatopsis thermoflava]|uniref:LPXTG-motif cell wall-anchored protein n=1 Tax=Amycolatopsis thermoflava TaxID=84480 RepID=A0A3N2H8S8_9PSEU|nr:LPXTG cell wall anchor domain-containing protein [Amycolatopsis thermoflava]ROS44740.1 LPXTG-motif cell wall-anchored protein [Amycolatopsis thermoflava]
MTFIGRRSLRAAVAGALLATGFVLGTATAHAAAEDPRATRHEGNASTCADAKLAGSILTSPDDYTYTRGKLEDDQYLDILTVSPDITVTGIVVKGGNAYNVYEPGKLGLPDSPPWTDLRAPVTGQNDNIPQLSHWFVCGTEKTTTTTTTATSTTGTETTTTTASSATSSTVVSTTSQSSVGTSSSSAAGGAVATTSGGPKATTQNAEELAYTGFDGGWLIALGAALVLGGAALVFVVRARRKA